MPILKIKKDGKWITIGSIDAKTLDNKPASYFAVADDVIELENYLENSLENKADKEHFHEISDVTDLEDSLENKADKEHFHEISDITELENSLENKADKEHFHKISDITEGILSIEQGGTNYSSMYDIQSESSATLRYRPSGLVSQETYPNQNQNGAIYWIYE